MGQEPAQASPSLNAEQLVQGRSSKVRIYQDYAASCPSHSYSEIECHCRYAIPAASTGDHEGPGVALSKREHDTRTQHLQCTRGFERVAPLPVAVHAGDRSERWKPGQVLNAISRQQPIVQVLDHVGGEKSYEQADSGCGNGVLLLLRLGGLSRRRGGLNDRDRVGTSRLR